MNRDSDDILAPGATRGINVPRLVQVPVGLEKVLCAAAAEPAFCEALLRDRRAAVESRGWTLRESEWGMLMAVPAEHLLASIRGTDTSPESLKRRGFLRTVAASAAVVAAAEVFESCGGARSDKPAPKPDGGKADQGSAAKDGQASDETVPIPDHGPAPTGIRPGG